MMRYRQIALIFWLASTLLLGQQLALAHMVGHAGERSQAPAEVQTATAHDEDESHGASDALLHVCSTCGTFLGLDLLLSGASAAGQIAAVWAEQVDVLIPPVPAFQRPTPFRSRAPPPLPS